jgi:acyl carrier protein
MPSTPTPSASEHTSLADDLAAYIDAEVSLGGERVEPGTDLVMTGLVDSLGVILIVEWLEQRLGITIDPADVVIEHFESVDAMVGYLRSRDDCVVG